MKNEIPIKWTVHKGGFYKQEQFKGLLNGRKEGFLKQAEFKTF